MKRLFDLVATGAGCLMILPVLLFLTMLVRIKHGAPIFFRQQRPGLHGTQFFMYKFRTMTNERDGNGNLLPDDQRLTSFGRFLRSASLDELPEFINVLKGETCLVGHRPLLMEYLPLYSAD